MPSEKTQAEKFEELARQLECDEDEAAFEGVVRKIASAPRTEKSEDAEG